MAMWVLAVPVKEVVVMVSLLLFICDEVNFYFLKHCNSIPMGGFWLYDIPTWWEKNWFTHTGMQSKSGGEYHDFDEDDKSIDHFSLEQLYFQ